MLILRMLLGTAFLIILLGKSLCAQQEEYYNDAVQLAARLSSEEQVSEIPKHLIYTIEDVLVLVADSPYQEAKLVQQYHIHAAARSSIQKLHLVIDNQAPWLDDLEGDNPITTYLHQQVIQLRILEQTEQYTLVELHSEQALNMRYLANELSILEYVWLVEIPSVQQVTKDIQLLAAEGGYRLIYSCSVSLEEQELHYWEFFVSATQAVTFVGEYGAALTVQKSKKSNRL